MLEFVKISQSIAPQLQIYKDAFNALNESIHGCAGINNYLKVEDWIDQVISDENSDTVQYGFVPALTYCLMDTSTQTLVGIVNIRTQLNDNLMNFGGHIGLSIHPANRNQGIGKRLLKQALEVCRELEISDVLITANDTNYASKRMIEASGGILENKVDETGNLICRYWIHL